jgi:hypothetical protein
MATRTRAIAADSPEMATNSDEIAIYTPEIAADSPEIAIYKGEMHDNSPEIAANSAAKAAHSPKITKPGEEITSLSTKTANSASETGPRSREESEATEFRPSPPSPLRGTPFPPQNR